MVNWGAGRDFAPARTLNHPEAVSRSVDKLEALQEMSHFGTSVVPFTTSKRQAEAWQREGRVVMARKLLKASEGRGIIVVEPQGRLPDAPLYTKYIKKQGEYRVHVFNGRVIDKQQKVLPRNHGGARNFFIRNSQNGFIFIRGGIETPRDCEVQGIRAVESLGLDFGAVDVIWGGRNAYVLEVNTAPGIEGTTVLSYAEAIRNYHQEQERLRN